MGVGVVMKQEKIIVTTAEASAGKNVDVGFIPAYVQIINRNAAVGENIKLEQYRGMPALESLATAVIVDSGTTADENVFVDFSTGLSDYDANAVSQVETPLTGSAFTRTIDTTLLTGTATLFLTEVNVGDRVRVGEEFLEVASITSNTVLNTTSVWRDGTGAVAAEVAVPGAEVSQSGFKGFTIPAAFMDDGDVLYYYALGTQFDEESA